MLISFGATAQENNPSEFYPVLKKTSTRFIAYQGCVSGNCKSGKGVYMTFKTSNSGSQGNSNYKQPTIYVFKGVFSDDGQKLVGIEHGFNTKYYHKSGQKKMTPTYTTLLDGTDPAFDKFLNYEGSFKLSDGIYVREGEKAIMHYAIANNEIYKNYLSDYYNGYKNRQYISYNDNYQYQSFEGWMNPGGIMLTGKLVLANGDIYQGTFFNNQYEGVGRLSTANGVKEGFWKNGDYFKRGFI